MVEDLIRARNRLTKFLLGPDHRGWTSWTVRHQQCHSCLYFTDRAPAATFAHYRWTVELGDVRYRRPIGPGVCF
jgi:hypothetical protein